VKLGAFPIITKTLLKESYRDFIAEGVVAHPQELADFIVKADMLSHGPLEVDFDSNTVIERTSGSSGTPFRCVKTHSERSAIAFSQWRERRRIDPSARTTGLYRFVHQGRTQFCQRDYSLSHLIGMYTALAESKARWLHAGPPMLERHIDIFRNNNVSFAFPALRFIECNGDILLQGAKRLFETFFDAAVVDLYGTTETWGIGYKQDHGFLVNTKNVWLEIVDNGNALITEPNKIGRIVVTALQLRLMPLVRYLTGDYGYFLPPHGRPEKPARFELIGGREIT
jgi:phenylacetate-CoA ligase